jgi:hypothetical protein
MSSSKSISEFYSKSYDKLSEFHSKSYEKIRKNYHIMSDNIFDGMITLNFFDVYFYQFLIFEKLAIRDLKVTWKL